MAFAPQAAGEQSATLTIESDDADEGSVDVPLSGNGVEDGGEEDATPPVCGEIAFERNDENQISAVVTSASDEESGIASVTFTRLRNLDGFAGEQGPFAQGETATFDADATTTVEIRGERQSFDQGGAITHDGDQRRRPDADVRPGPGDDLLGAAHALCPARELPQPRAHGHDD